MTGIRRLAKHLDISIGTVSRALNNKPDVNEKTRRRVLEAAAELGYVPNQAGRALRKGSTNVIGFMMQTGSEITGEGDTFFMSVFDGVQSVFARHQLDLVALLCSSEEDPDAYIRRIEARGFADAFIISATQRNDSRIDYLAERKVPFIALGRSLSDAGHPWIDLDFEGMADIGVNRLIAAGHQRVGIFVPPDDTNLGYIFAQRYQAVLEENGIAFDESLIFRATPNIGGGYEIARQILAMEDRPTALFIVNEVMTQSLYKGLIEAGIIPGRDIAIIGRDSPHTRFLSPRLTGFRMSLRDMGIELAENLLATMPAYKHIYTQGAVRKVWKLDLIEGESDAMVIAR